MVLVDYLSNGPSQADGNNIRSSTVRNYINSDLDRSRVHHYAFLTNGGPLPGVVGVAWLGTACLGGNYPTYKVSSYAVFICSVILHVEINILVIATKS